MKITINSHPDDIISTLTREWQMAINAYYEHRGGAEELSKWQDTLLARASNKQEGFIADTYLWTSPDGNKWCVFEDVTYDKASTYTHTCSYAFCYYETIPYAGIFFHVNTSIMGNGNEDGAVIYESHFFERLCERNILKWEGMKTLISFISQNHANAIYCTDIEKKQYDLRINGCICRGWAHKDNPRLIRIKTVLSDEMLSTKQRRDTAKGRRFGDSTNKYIDLKFEDVLKRNKGRYAMAKLNGTEDELLNESTKDFARQIGVSQEEAENIMAYATMVDYVLSTLRPRYEKTLQYYLEAFDAGMAIKNDWEDNHDDELSCRVMIDAIMKASKTLKMNIPKGSVIKTIYNLTKKVK